MTYIYTITGLLLAVAALATLVIRRNSKETTATRLARERASERFNARAFADTVPDNDPYLTLLRFQHAVGVTEMNDKYSGYADVTDEQYNIINLLLKEDKPINNINPRNYS